MLYSIVSQYYYKFSFFITILYFLFAQKHIAMNLLESMICIYRLCTRRSTVARGSRRRREQRHRRASAALLPSYHDKICPEKQYKLPWRTVKNSTNPYNFYNPVTLTHTYNN